jgi:uncharacterized protein
VVTHVGTWQRVAHLTAISQLLVELLTERSFTMPHTKRQLDALNQILVDLPDDGDGMLLSEFDGFVVSLIVCPDLIPPSQWIPVVWGEEQGSNFDSIQATQKTLDAIMSHYNLVARNLAKPEPEYECILETVTITDEALWEPWISGFERGMRIVPHSWDVMIESDDEEVRSMIPMILALNDIDNGRSHLDEAAIDHLDAMAPDLIPDMVLKLNSCIKNFGTGARFCVRSDDAGH